MERGANFPLSGVCDGTRTRHPCSWYTCTRSWTSEHTSSLFFAFYVLSGCTEPPRPWTSIFVGGCTVPQLEKKLGRGEGEEEVVFPRRTRSAKIRTGKALPPATPRGHPHRATLFNVPFPGISSVKYGTSVPVAVGNFSNISGHFRTREEY